MPSTHELLAAHTLFLGFPAALLADLAAVCELRRFDVDEPVFQTGMPNEGVYFLVSGEVKLFSVSAAGEHLLGKLGANETLGDLGAFAPQKHIVNVSATAATLVVYLPLARLQQLGRDKPGVATQVAFRLMRRFAMAARRLGVEKMLHRE